MAKFSVKKMYKKKLVPYWDSFSFLAPSTWFRREYDSLGCKVHVMVDGSFIKELTGKIGYHEQVHINPGYVFEVEAPEGDVWVDCDDDVVCEVVRIA